MGVPVSVRLRGPDLASAPVERIPRVVERRHGAVATSGTALDGYGALLIDAAGRLGETTGWAAA